MRTHPWKTHAAGLPLRCQRSFLGEDPLQLLRGTGMPHSRSAMPSERPAKSVSWCRYLRMLCRTSWPREQSGTNSASSSVHRNTPAPLHALLIDVLRNSSRHLVVLFPSEADFMFNYFLLLQKVFVSQSGLSRALEGFPGSCFLSLHLAPGCVSTSIRCAVLYFVSWAVSYSTGTRRVWNVEGVSGSL